VRIQRILCPVDFSEVSWKAYRYAQSMAGHYRATLVVQHVIEPGIHPCGFYSSSAPLFEDFCRLLGANGRYDLQQFVSRSGGIRPECIVQGGIAADKILSLARERAISLMVLGTHGRRGFNRLLSGSVTERILRHASCPVFTVRQSAGDSNKPDADAKDDSVRIRRILCCVDLSARAGRTMKYALSLAEACHAEVTILHVLENVSGSADIAGETKTAEANLGKLIPPATNSSIVTHLAVRQGNACQGILQFASQTQPDVIVTGVRGHHALELAVFGSFTWRVIQLGPCPVLAVPT
jgi:nucleotide-binding universal stress UspA family protein